MGITKTFLLVALPVTAMLTGCGGGGGDSTSNSSSDTGGSSSTTTSLQASSIKGVDVALTYNGTTLTAIVPTAVSQASSLSASSLNAFTVNDAYGDASSQYAFSLSGISVANFYDGTARANSTAYSVGGTSWSYSRFGIFENAVGTSAQYTVRNTPFFVANVTSPNTLSDATYATSGKAVGLMATATSKTQIKCDFSAAYTQSTQQVLLTLSACTTASGATVVPVSGTIALTPTGFTLNAFTINDGVALTASNVTSYGYKFGGATGQELVGAATVTGTNGYFTFAFGAKK